jgi:Fe-S cluster biosynthesis and repair protein YggX
VVDFVPTKACHGKIRGLKCREAGGETMQEVQCVRCGNPGAPITEPLYLGKLESQIKTSICAACWAEWVKMRVMVINEYQVNLGDESGRALVKEQMLSFLKLPKPEPQQK